MSTISKTPAVGKVYAMKLEDGRYGACRVLQMDEENGILVAASAWIGKDIPDMEEPLLKTILKLTHHSWDGKPEIVWVDGAAPDHFTPIGWIDPTEEEQQIDCWSWGAWEGLDLQVLRQWRWDHDREALLKEDEIKAEKRQKDQEIARQAYQKYLNEVTLEQLLNKPIFLNWEGYAPDAALDASRELIQRTIKALMAIGEDPDETQRMAILEQCIEGFNTLDGQHDWFIETVEREDICEVFYEITHACNMNHHEDLADQWRDW